MCQKISKIKLGNDICLGDFEPHTVSVMRIVQNSASFGQEDLLRKNLCYFPVHTAKKRLEIVEKEKRR